MPPLDETMVNSLKDRLKAHLSTLGLNCHPVFLNAGASAAVFQVITPSGLRAYKVFDPRFLDGVGGDAERKRLRLQEKLAGHACEHLIKIYGVMEAENTAFIEMELCPWPRLSDSLPQVPDTEVSSLISQLVEVVRYLEELGIVHRDIKPENIHISPDFKALKVLDLGVARGLDAGEGELTDRDHLRPFVATAQYSSPEYLFRLDEPTTRLWKALNLYQVGAVLHDLIMKSALFQDEVSLGNRWLVARAVLAKTPSFADANPSRLAALKALSAKCLVKDMETRLQIVSWSDFALDSAHEPLAHLRSRLERSGSGSLDSSAAALDSRLRFDRSNFERAFIELVRLELIAICGKKLPLSLKHPTPESPFAFEFSYSPSIKFKSCVRIEWLRELYSRTAEVCLGEDKVCAVTISEAEDQAVYTLSSALAEVVGQCLDLVESNSFAREKGVYPVESNRGQVEVE